jgi:hypothetical protein
MADVRLRLFPYTMVKMQTAQEKPVSLQVSTEFIKEQRVVRMRPVVSVATYRARAVAGIEKLFSDLVSSGENATGAPFCILHDHFDWDHDIDLEICVPVRRWANLSERMQSRRVPATAVFSVDLAPHALYELAQVKGALLALERAVIEKSRIFAGDVREVYPWGKADRIKLQIPIV